MTLSKRTFTDTLEHAFMTMRKHPLVSTLRDFRDSKNKLLSIMLHNGELSLIVLQKRLHHYHVSHIIRETLPESWFENGKLKNDEGFSVLLKTMCQKHGLKSKPVVFMSDDPHILPRVLTIPKRPAKWIAHYLHEEVQKYVLFSGKPVKLNWKILETIDIDGIPHYRVIVLSIKSETFTRWNTIFKRAGLYLKGISTHSLGLEYTISKSKPKQSQVIISIEPKQTIIFSRHKGSIHSLHVIPTTAASLISSPDDIKRLQSTLATTLKNASNSSVFYYCACWIPNQKKELFTAMQQVGATPLEYDDLLDSISYDDNLNYPIESYITAIGSGEITEDDLLLVDLSQGQPYFDVLMGYFMISIGFISILMLLAFFLFQAQTKSLSNTISTVKTELDSLNKQYQVVNAIDTDISTAKHLIVERRKKIQDDDVFDAEDFFMTLPDALNTNIRLRKFKLNSDKLIVLDGEAKGPDDVFALLQNLKKSPYFVMPELKEVIQSDTSTLVRFVINAKLGDAHVDN